MPELPGRCTGAGRSRASTSTAGPTAEAGNGEGPGTCVPGPSRGATLTGLEPATSAVTGRHSNQLSYRAILFVIRTPVPLTEITLPEVRGASDHFCCEPPRIAGGQATGSDDGASGRQAGATGRPGGGWPGHGARRPDPSRPLGDRASGTVPREPCPGSRTPGIPAPGAVPRSCTPGRPAPWTPPRGPAPGVARSTVTSRSRWTRILERQVTVGTEAPSPALRGGRQPADACRVRLRRTGTQVRRHR